MANPQINPKSVHGSVHTTYTVISLQIQNLNKQRNKRRVGCSCLGKQIHFVFEVNDQILGVNDTQNISKFLLLTRCIPFWLNIMSTFNIKAHRSRVQRSKQRPVITKPVLIGWCSCVWFLYLLKICKEESIEMYELRLIITTYGVLQVTGQGSGVYILQYSFLSTKHLYKLLWPEAYTNKETWDSVKLIELALPIKP